MAKNRRVTQNAGNLTSCRTISFSRTALPCRGLLGQYAMHRHGGYRVQSIPRTKDPQHHPIKQLYENTFVFLGGLTGQLTFERTIVWWQPCFSLPCSNLAHTWRM